MILSIVTFVKSNKFVGIYHKCAVDHLLLTQSVVFVWSYLRVDWQKNAILIVCCLHIYSFFFDHAYAKSIGTLSAPLLFKAYRSISQTYEHLSLMKNVYKFVTNGHDAMSPWLRENAGHYWYETRVVDDWLQPLRNNSATVSMAYAWQRLFI